MFVTVRFRTYCHATEDEGRVREALMSISGVTDKDIKVTVNKGFHGNEIQVLETVLTKGPGLTSFLERLVQAGVFERVEHEIMQRLDDECVLYLRFDKQEAYKGKLVLDSGENTIQVRAKVQAYPARPKRAVEEIKAHIEKIEKGLARSSKKDDDRRRN